MFQGPAGRLEVLKLYRINERKMNLWIEALEADSVLPSTAVQRNVCWLVSVPGPDACFVCCTNILQSRAGYHRSVICLFYCNSVHNTR